MSYNPCECPIAGYCNRYRKDMSQAKWGLCQKQEKYRMLFDEIAGNADFGMWKTAKKGNIPAGIARTVKIKTGPQKQKTLMTEEQRASIIQEHRQVEKALQELEEANIDVNTIDKESEGLGDDIEKVLTKFGITQKLMSKMLKRSCKCNERKEFLNKLFPYVKKK